MPPFLASLLATERGRKLVGFGTLAIGLIVLVGLIMLLQQCSVDERVEQGVALDRAEVSADGYNRGMIAERAVIANQMAAEATYHNEQDESDDAIDDAARRRVSPLDALFNSLR